MVRQGTCISAAVLVALVGLSGAAAAQELKPVVTGSTLTGWQQQGGATWRAQGGELVGSVGAGGAGWLVSNATHQDILVDLAVRCTGCQAGVLLRGQRQGDQLTGEYIAITGPDAGTVYQATFDAQGREVSKNVLTKGAIPTPSGFTDREPGEAGWNEAEVVLRGAGMIGNVDGATWTQAGGGSNPPKFVLADSIRAGSLALRIAGAPGTEVRFKDVVAADLLTRAALQPEKTGAGFRTVQLSDQYYSEGIATADFNHDGNLDVVSGPYIYLGPDFKTSREIYKGTPAPMTGYTSWSMVDFAYDFNGDGWVDVLQMGFGQAFLYLNPKNANQHWERTIQMAQPNPLNSETNVLADVDGDGKIDVIGLSAGRVGYWTLNWSNVTTPWTFHAVSTRKNTWGPHGFGAADLNGDGKADILQARGWFERPTSPSDTLWTYHETPFGRGDIINGYDVDGDGDLDVVGSGFAHGWGLSWYESRKGADGVPTFTEHKIMDRVADAAQFGGVGFSELHGVALVDVDGDGLKDIVTGKRWWSHLDNGEEDVLSQPVMYWFKLSRTGGKVTYTPHLIHNNSGVGAQVAVADLNGDRKPDIITAARKGTFIFFNEQK
jgi:hypothetical protein